ncbi:MAG: DNA methyltransferase [Candidatus Caldarchaeum sp.]|nr:DNA methyltransferase [Candidatus Caldarchaeum sp.]
MRRVDWDEYRDYVRRKGFVAVENVKIPVGMQREIKTYRPEEQRLETTTVWSFPERGSWATHSGDYRGNWSPHIPRNLLLKYSKPGEWVLDQMAGSGTTLVEAKLLGRNAVGVDINYEAVILAMDRLNFKVDGDEGEVKLYHGDARNLERVEDESIDLIATHPPYWGVIKYTSELDGDLSAIKRLEDYLKEMGKVASESYRVLKAGRYCAVLIGDTRRHKHYVPLSYRVMQLFLKAGFVLAEDIIKLQHNMKATRLKWRGERFELYGFHKIAHEHLFVFRKPRDEAERLKLRKSVV